MTYKDFEWDRMTIQKVVKSDILSDETFLCLRLLMGLVIWSTLVHSLLLDKVGLQVNIATRQPGKTKFFHIFGFQRLGFFTWWSWLLEGIYFLILTILSLESYYNLGLSQILGEKIFSSLVPLAWIFFQINFAVSCLVSIIVKHVLIPGNRKDNVPTDVFFQPIALLTHNANILFMSSELIFSNMTFSTWHVAFAIIYAMSYVLFSWFWFLRVGVFYYFFLDYANEHSHFLYVGLCTIFSCFFYFGFFISYVKENSILLSTVLIFGLLYSSIQIKDY